MTCVGAIWRKNLNDILDFCPLTMMNDPPSVFPLGNNSYQFLQQSAVTLLCPGRTTTEYMGVMDILYVPTGCSAQTKDWRMDELPVVGAEVHANWFRINMTLDEEDWDRLYPRVAEDTLDGDDNNSETLSFINHITTGVLLGLVVILAIFVGWRLFRFYRENRELRAKMAARDG
ncbi:MAG: hypothetical protein CEE38_23530 [Planctomycetes bacterium B3_Pla]|nr:MAG: hypothetical protein CEE38_23530 [Planctomycetes bacterium B3_Pla]